MASPTSADNSTLNSWLRDLGYLGPREYPSIMHDIDWSSTTAYGLGTNGLYLNMKEPRSRGRNRRAPARKREEALLRELKERSEGSTDHSGERVIRRRLPLRSNLHRQLQQPWARPTSSSAMPAATARRGPRAWAILPR